MKASVIELIFIVCLLQMCVTSADKTWSSSSPPFTIVEARRELLGDNVRFTVQLTSLDPLLTTRWENYYSEKVESNDTELGNGVFETTALLSSESIEDNPFMGPGLMLAQLKVTSAAYEEDLILLLNYDTTDGVSRDVSMPIFEVYPDGDFVYEDGQEDFTYKMRIPVDYRYYGSQEFLLTPVGDVVNGFSGYHSDLIASQSYADYYEVTMTVSTEWGRVSGVLALNVEQRPLDSSVVNTIIRQKMVTLRPEGQRGPFPDGFLSFVKSPSLIYQPQDGITECAVGRKCKFDCAVAGSDITQVEIVVVDSHGNSRPLDSSKYDVEEEFALPYLSYKVVTFYENSVPETPEMLRCTAENADGRKLVKESTVMVVRTP